MRTVSTLLACVLIAGGTACSAHAAETATTVVYLVRHAETAPPGGDPDPSDRPLSESGVERAADLVGVLRAEGITHVFSTEFRRTMETARPLAEHFGLEIERYDPRALEELATRLRSLPGRHVVVGHSNTTPRLVALLGGEPGEPIDEAREYDRLYVVVMRGTQPAVTLGLRYLPTLTTTAAEVSPAAQPANRP